MKMDWWRACWRSKSGSGKGNETSQSESSSKSDYNKRGGRVTVWRKKQGRTSRQPGTAIAGHTALRVFSPTLPRKRNQKKVR